MRIAVCNLKGGVGKSCTAIAIAECARRQNRTVMVIDSDAEQCSYRWANMVGIEAISSDPADPIKLIKNAEAHDPDVMVIDTSSAHPEMMSPAMEVSDLVLIPTLPTGMDIGGTYRTCQHLWRVQKMRKDGSPPGLIFLNGVIVGTTLSDEALEAIREGIMGDSSEINLRLLETIIYERIDIGRSFGWFKTVWEMTTPGAKKAVEAYESLFEEVTKFEVERWREQL